jgi:hypothetical protein
VTQGESEDTRPPTSPGAAPSPTSSKSAPVAKLGSRAPANELYPEDVIPPSGPGISLGGAAAAIFLVIIVILLVLMGTGYNNNIPYLHAGSPPGLTIAGDRDTFHYLLANGTIVTTVVDSLCAQCPFTVPYGAQFTYTINITNGFSGVLEVTAISTLSPFEVSGFTPVQTQVAGGLSQDYTVTIDAPDQGGAFAVPLIVQADVG